MDYRTLILTELNELWEQKGPGNFLAAEHLKCRKVGDEAYVVALNRLLAEELILGVSGNEGTIAIALNPKKLATMQSPVQNNVTIHLGAGSTFTGPLNVGHTIQQSYSTASEANTTQLRERLQALVVNVGHLVESISPPEQKSEVSQKLKTFVQQANEASPSKDLLQFTGNGLVKAAETVSNMIGPVTAAVKAVLDLLV
jgi:transcriptional regulator with GAF, ATPase, and Fis domain